MAHSRDNTRDRRRRQNCEHEIVSASAARISCTQSARSADDYCAVFREPGELTLNGLAGGVVDDGKCRATSGPIAQNNVQVRQTSENDRAADGEAIDTFGGDSELNPERGSGCNAQRLRGHAGAIE